VKPTAFLLVLYGLLLWLLSGCVPLSPLATDGAPRTDSQAWCKNISFGRAAWISEARKRFGPDVFVFVAHGGPDSKGVWTVYPDSPRLARPVETLAWDLHLAMPDRDVVLVVCNGGHATLKVPRVWYATNIVRTRPHDPFCPAGEVDDIWKFRCD
jgi:hypothetical protein